MESGRRLRAAAHQVATEVWVSFAATRVGLTLVGVLAGAAFANPAAAAGPTGLAWIDVWSRWDAGFYVQIAQMGYNPLSELPNIVFFPLYPAIIRLVAFPFGFEALPASALFVSAVSLVVALWYLVALVRLDMPEKTAVRTAVYLLVFPTTLYLSAGYPESLFLALALGAVYSARKERWWAVGLLGLAAALTRPYGALLAVPLAFEYLYQKNFDVRRVRLDALWIGLAPLGLVAFLAYLAVKFDAGAFARAQETWGRRVTAPWDLLARYFDGPIIVHGFPTEGASLIDLAFVLFFVGLVSITWWQLRPTYALYGSLMLAAFLSSGAFTSVPRYGLALFPVFILLGRWGEHEHRHAVILSLSLLLAGFAMAIFATVRWLA